VTVLHDASLLDFYRAYLDGEGPEFAKELRFNHGALPGGTGPYRTGPDGELDRMALPFLRRIAEASLGLVVHSDWALDDLRRRYPHKPVFHIPLGVPLLPETPAGLALRRRLGWGAGDVVFGLLGGIWPHKRLDLPIRIFAAIRRLAPNSRLLIAGRNESPETLAEIVALSAALGLGRDAQILTELANGDFDAALLASDVLVDLRPPTAGEVPATVMRAFGAGRPVLTSDLPQLRGFPSSFCWRVPVDELNAITVAAETMLLLAREPSRIRAAGRGARSFIAGSRGLDETAQSYLDVANAVIEAKGSTLAPAGPLAKAHAADSTSPVRPGVNVLGDFEATTGLMEAGRQALLAMADAGVDVNITALRSGSPHSPTRRVAEIEALPVGRDHDIDLWFVNIDDFRGLTDDDLRGGSDRYVIGWWHWEAPKLPAFAATQLRRVDEIWVSSQFVANACRWAGPTPVTVMPCVVDAPLPPHTARADYGLPDDACLFFYSFDVNSSDARKNPWGLVEAFGRAFTDAERRGPVRLVVKVQNLGPHPARGPLLDALHSVNAILIEDELPRHAMSGLIGSIDVYASLHRAEGFGLGMAEAMFLGKPVIATAYSGNMDFTTAANSCLVGFTLRPIEESDHRHHPRAGTVYEPGLLWAEPDIAQAARWMRFLYDFPAERGRIGSAGAATVRNRYRPDLVGRAIAHRLDAIRRARCNEPTEVTPVR
jgi:glycosyltransferase involved in cell wall biosynthesis